MTSTLMRQRLPPAEEVRMLVPAGLRLVGAYAAASEESPAKLAALARQLGALLPPHLVRALGRMASTPSTLQLLPNQTVLAIMRARPRPRMTRLRIAVPRSRSRPKMSKPAIGAGMSSTHGTPERNRVTEL